MSMMSTPVRHQRRPGSFDLDGEPSDPDRLSASGPERSLVQALALAPERAHTENKKQEEKKDEYGTQYGAKIDKEVESMHPPPPPYVPMSQQTYTADTHPGPSAPLPPPTTMHWEAPAQPLVHDAGAPPPPDLNPANYIHIHKHNSRIDGRFLLDIGLAGAPAPPFTAESDSQKDAKKCEKREKEERGMGLGAGAWPSEIGGAGVRPNLLLESHNAPVSGEVWVVGGARAQQRTMLKFLTHNAKASAVVHAFTSVRPHLSILVRTHNGSASLALPRSFQGRLAISTANGHIRMSTALEAASVTIGETHSTRTVVVGAMTGPGEEVDEAAVVTKNGGINVRFDDEPGTEGRIGATMARCLGM